MTPVAGSDRARRDIAHDITQSLLAELERGVLPWRKPWDMARVSKRSVTLPLRITGEPYRGVNVVLLWSAAAARGYTTPTWLTFRQTQALGGQVRRGERGQTVVYYGRAQHTRTDADGAETDNSFRFLKSFIVFNVEQTTGLPQLFAGPSIEDPPTPVLPATYAAWFARFGIPRIVTQGIACYWPARDAIGMPPLDAFDSIEHAQSTELHELGHATGHASRTARDLRRYGAHEVAAEELTAEIFSAIAGTWFQLPPAHLHDHAAYIASWMSLLKHDKRAFFSAAAKAQAAIDWTLKANPPPGYESAGAADVAA